MKCGAHPEIDGSIICRRCNWRRFEDEDRPCWSMQKPLFIPLKTEWFRQFEAGTKDTEYRAYGPRWNENTCRIGRKAIVSHGYSGKRLERVVVGFQKVPRIQAPDVARHIYPDAAFIAAIHTAPALFGESRDTP